MALENYMFYCLYSYGDFMYMYIVYEVYTSPTKIFCYSTIKMKFDQQFSIWKCRFNLYTKSMKWQGKICRKTILYILHFKILSNILLNLYCICIWRFWTIHTLLSISTFHDAYQLHQAYIWLFLKVNLYRKFINGNLSGKIYKFFRDHLINIS